MKFVLHGVTVENWSRDPFLNLGQASRDKLGTAILYSRQIVDDALHVLRKYVQRTIVASVDVQMARDYFDEGERAAADEALDKYFGLSAASPTYLNDVQVVINKFQQIKAGLDQPFDLIVGYIHDLADVAEGVRDATVHAVQGQGRAAVRDLKYIRTGTEGWVGNGFGHSQRRIHLNKDSIKTEPAGKIARIIVHEASHKFAGTVDVAYKWQNLRHNGGGHAGLTNNADSFAWGGRLMWKRKRRLQGGV